MKLELTESDFDYDVLTPVRFTVRKDTIEHLLKRAAELDDEEHGEHLAEYTIPQALLVVFHMDPNFLFDNLLLNGWVFDPSGDLWQGAQWVPEGTPEGHVIEEDPL